MVGHGRKSAYPIYMQAPPHGSADSRPPCSLPPGPVVTKLLELAPVRPCTHALQQLFRRSSCPSAGGPRACHPSSFTAFPSACFSALHSSSGQPPNNGLILPLPPLNLFFSLFHCHVRLWLLPARDCFILTRKKEPREKFLKPLSLLPSRVPSS